MPIKCETYEHVGVLTVQGDLSGELVQESRQAVQHLIDERQVVDFALDLEKCSFIDSEGLETLLWIKDRSEGLFGRLALANVDENCRKILEITRLAHRFECHDELPAALKAMR